MRIEKSTAGEPRGDGVTGLHPSDKKILRGEDGGRPYRKPTQAGWCKRTKANERDSAKELGKLSP